MILLRFTARNHGSIRDEISLDLSRPSLQRLTPSDGDWSEAAFPLAGIFGGNATGKSAILDAIIYTFSAIRSSATSWQASKTMYRNPHRLDPTSRDASSSYELDFVYEGRRHLYGFEVDAEGVKSEWLRDIPSSRWRTLLDRDRNSGRLMFHASMRSKIEVTRRELVLSRALLLEDSPLHPLAHELARCFDFVLVKDSHREARLKDIADSLAEGTITFSDLEVLLQVADIGVVKVDIEETNLSEHVRLALRRFIKAVSEDDATDTESISVDPDELDDEQLAQVARHLVFTHRGSTGECPRFSIQDESDGTIAWLAIAVPALEVLRRGGLLVVDEIDASLHPHLLEALLGVFDDELVNKKHAQLVFTSHESYILSPLSEVTLEAEQVWFTDKSYEGVTELTCLADFPRHPDANVAKRYLTGRYGGTPRLSPNSFAALVNAEGH